MPNNKKRRKQYPQEFKDSILKRLNQPSNETVASISEEIGVSKATIYQWIRKNNQTKNSNPVNLKSKTNWTSEDKFNVVLETATLTQNELAEYCRRKGIYVEEIQVWKEQCLSANTNLKEDPRKLLRKTKQESKN